MLNLVLALLVIGTTESLETSTVDQQSTVTDAPVFGVTSLGKFTMVSQIQ